MTVSPQEKEAIRVAHDLAHAHAEEAAARWRELAEHRQAVFEGRERLHGSSPEQVQRAITRAELAQQRARAARLRAADADERARAANDQAGQHGDH